MSRFSVGVSDNKKFGAGFEDQRSANRRIYLDTGILHFDDGVLSRECNVRNITRNGAQIELVKASTLPRRFKLQLSDANERKKCRIAWQKERVCGLEFI